MAKVDTLVLDKTGTVTIGKPEVIKETLLSDFDKNLLYSLVKLSKHPVSKGIQEYLLEESKNLSNINFDEYKQIPSSGISAKLDSKEILGGNLRLMQENGIIEEYKSENTLFYFAIDKKIVAIYALSDTIKEGAKELIENLAKKGVQTIMLTGDNEMSAKKVASAIGLEQFYFEQTPEDKSEFIAKLHTNKKTVVMVGDGINDILALARADIGIVMGSGSDIAVDVSDVVLLNSSLKSLEESFKISRTTYGLIKQNLGISLVYNAITIPLAMAGYVIPLVAAISMSVSSLLVVGNSMRINLKWNK